MLPRTLPALALSALTAALLLTASASPAQARDVRMGLGAGARLGSDGASLTGSLKLGLELVDHLFAVGQLETFLAERSLSNGGLPAGWRLGLMVELPLPLPVGLDFGASVGQSRAPQRFAESYAAAQDTVTAALAEVGLTAKLGPARLRFYANMPVWSADPDLMDRVHSTELGLRLGLAL